MHVPTNVKSPNNISKWQMGFNSAFKGLIISGWRKDLHEIVRKNNNTFYFKYMFFENRVVYELITKKGGGEGSRSRHVIKIDFVCS
jgi:hypothetical protein